MIHFDFTNQTAVVTGGTRGIGAAVSAALLDAGATVIATHSGNSKAAAEFANAHSEASSRLRLCAFDVGEYAAAEDFYKTVCADFAHIDILVNNAGIRRDGVVGMLSERDWSAVLRTNLNGTYNMSKFAVHRMMQQRYGRIINITSPSGREGFAGQANYAASKAGVVAFTRSLSKEVAKRRITVNCVSPGFIETDFLAGLSPEQIDSYRKSIPLQRFGDPAEVADTVLFLASKEAAYITGATLEVSGGL